MLPVAICEISWMTFLCSKIYHITFYNIIYHQLLQRLKRENGTCSPPLLGGPFVFTLGYINCKNSFIPIKMDVFPLPLLQDLEISERNLQNCENDFIFPWEREVDLFIAGWWEYVKKPTKLKQCLQSNLDTRTKAKMPGSFVSYYLVCSLRRGNRGTKVRDSKSEYSKNEAAWLLV